MKTQINKTAKVDSIIFEKWLATRELSNLDRHAILTQINSRDQEIKELKALTINESIANKCIFAHADCDNAQRTYMTFTPEKTKHLFLEALNQKDIIISDLCNQLNKNEVYTKYNETNYKPIIPGSNEVKHGEDTINNNQRSVPE